jgi:NAD(P)-dependent dehydrogenase (short-subunit alcohol dehydrogenase family)
MTIRAVKKVLITGAQGALGSQVAKRFLQENCQIVATYSPESELIKEELESSIQWVKVDLTSSDQVRSAFHGQEFDAWIHCAGGFRFRKVDETTDEDLDFLINLNLRSAFYLAREILGGMKKQNFGRIVFISSKATLHPTAGMGAYAASKAGLNMLTACLAEETKSYDITVNSVLPSIIDTPANRKDMSQAKYADWVTPKELSEIIYSLMTPFGKPFHGALLPVSGRLV